MKVPADLYARSPRVYRGLKELTYPFHDQTIMVTGCGRICFRGRKVNLSHVFAGQSVGVTQVGERIWLVTFMHYDLGYFDDETCQLNAQSLSDRTTQHRNSNFCAVETLLGLHRHVGRTRHHVREVQ